MTKRTALLCKPVVSLLSPSPAISRKTQEILDKVLKLDPVELPSQFHDVLDEKFSSRLPGQSKIWDSVASRCPSSGTLVHLISLSNATSESSAAKQSGISLLSIQDYDGNDGTDGNTISKARESFAAQISSYSQRMSLALKHTLQRPIAASDVLGFGGGLPLLHFQSEPTTSGIENVTNGLKEITIPHFDDATYRDNGTLLQELREAPLHRPVVGLFQLSNGVTIRPLPTAKEDRSLPEPSLVFHCTHVEETAALSLSEKALIAKIGYTGQGNSGQYMLVHENIPGLGIRLTQEVELCSSFAEAQDALLAGSLSELQSINVLKEGGGQEESSSDPLIGVGDCWMELRANMKKPSGFMQRNVTTQTTTRVASVPDLPYE